MPNKKIRILTRLLPRTSLSLILNNLERKDNNDINIIKEIKPSIKDRVPEKRRQNDETISQKYQRLFTTSPSSNKSIIMFNAENNDKAAAECKIPFCL